MPHVAFYAVWLGHATVTAHTRKSVTGRQLADSGALTKFSGEEKRLSRSRGENPAQPPSDALSSVLCAARENRLKCRVQSGHRRFVVIKSRMPHLWTWLLLFSAVGALRQPIIGGTNRRPRTVVRPHPNPSPPSLRRAHDKGSKTAEIDVPKTSKASIKIKPAKFHNLRLARLSTCFLVQHWPAHSDCC